MACRTARRLAQEAMARDGQAIRSVVLASPLARSFSSQAEQPLSTQRALERVFAACARQPSCRDAFPTVEQDFYALYDELTTSPVPVPIVRPDGRRDTLWLDGERLVDDIRNRMLNRPRLGVARLPLLLHELRAGDRSRAAREIVGDVLGRASDRALRAVINCADHATHGAVYRRTLDSVNARRASAIRSARRSGMRGVASTLARWSDAGAAAQRHSHPDPDWLLRRQNADGARSPHRRHAQSRVPRRVSGRGPRRTPPRVPRGHCREVLRGSDAKPGTSCVATIPPITFATAWEPTRGP